MNNFQIVIDICKKDLIIEYITKRQSTTKTAEFFGCGRETIRKLLVKYDIPRINKNNKLQGKDHHNYKGGLPNCIDCGNQVSHYSVIRCIKCSNKGILNSMYNIHRFGKKSPNYKHGLSGKSYPHEFNIKKDYIFRRDNSQYQNCGITEIEHLNKYNTKLHVHHINYNKFDNIEFNLITTCMNCNLKANGNRDYWFAYYTYIMENYK